MPDRLLNFSETAVSTDFVKKCLWNLCTVIFAKVNGNFASDAHSYAAVKSILKVNLQEHNLKLWRPSPPREYFTFFFVGACSPRPNLSPSAQNLWRPNDSIMVPSLNKQINSNVAKLFPSRIIWGYDMCTRLYVVARAHNPERLTSILRLCNGVFTSRFIFR